MTWEKKEVWQAPEFWTCGVQGHCKSYQTQRLSFLSPWSGDKWRHLSRFRNSEVPLTATCRSVFVPLAVSCLTADYFFFFLCCPLEEVYRLCFEFLRSFFFLFFLLGNQRQLWSCEQRNFLSFYNRDFLCSCYSHVWKKNWVECVFVLWSSDREKKRHSCVSGH